MRLARLSDAVRIAIGAFAGVGLLFTATGCLATRNWVNDQLQPIKGQQAQLETQVNNLHLERKLVLDSSTGPTFASGSASLSPNAKREIDAFLEDMDGPAVVRAGGGSASSWSPGIPTASAMRPTTTSSDSGALPVSPGTGRPKGPRPDPGSGDFLRRE